MQDRRRKLMTCGFVLLLILVALLIQVVRRDEPQVARSSSVVTQEPIANQQTVEASMAEKTRIEEQYAHDLETALASPTGVKDPYYVPPTSPPAATPILGIRADSGPMPIGTGSLYRMQNAWVGKVNDEYIRVVAGTMAEDPIYGIWGDPEQGVVVIFGTNGPDGTYTTPGKTGSVRVVAADGLQLTLESTQIPAQFRFDVATRAWLTSPRPDKSP